MRLLLISFRCSICGLQLSLGMSAALNLAARILTRFIKRGIFFLFLLGFPSAKYHCEVDDRGVLTD